MVVRLIERTGADRLDPTRPEPYMLECGFDDPTAADVQARGNVRKERGRMVSVLLVYDWQLPEAIHVLADLWTKACREDASLRRAGEIPVHFDIPDGGRGIVTLHAEDLATWLHRMADKWAQRQTARRLSRRIQVPAAMMTQ